MGVLPCNVRIGIGLRSLFCLGLLMLLAGCPGSSKTPVMTTVAVGQWPNDAVFDNGTGRLFVADECSATLTALTGEGQPLGIIDLTTRARHLAVDPALGHLYAPNEGSGLVAVFDTHDLKERFRVAVGRRPHGIAVDHVSHRVFVGNEGDASLTAFDGQTGRVLYTVPVGQGPGGIAVDPSTARVVVVSVPENRLYLVDGQTGRVRSQFPAGTGPTHIRLNGRTGLAYVLNTEGNSVTVLDVRQERLRSTFDVDQYPIGIALDEATGRVYIVNNRSNTLSIIDGTTFSVVRLWRIPRNVSSATLAPQAGLLYLTLKSDNRVALLRLRDL